jgi:adenine phosphoribosyltransferase
MQETELAALIRDIPDWPEPGIVFKDITPLLADGAGFQAALDAMVAPHRGTEVTKVIGIEARGFIFAAPIASILGAGFVPIRKKGKLPHDIHHQEYDLEYGTDRIEVHSDGITPGDKVLIVDDVLATGGTAAAAVALVEALGGEVVAFCVLVELDFLNGRSRLVGTEVHSVVHYGGT